MPYTRLPGIAPSLQLSLAQVCQHKGLFAYLAKAYVQREAAVKAPTPAKNNIPKTIVECQYRTTDRVNLSTHLETIARSLHLHYQLQF